MYRAYGVLMHLNPLYSESNQENEYILQSYLIIPRYGLSLEQYFLNVNQTWSVESIVHLGSYLIDSLRLIHEVGYTYNDLKLDNIMVGYDQELPNDSETNIFAGKTLHLIDFGFASKYVDKKNGEHLPKRDTDLFRGTLTFCSLN